MAEETTKQNPIIPDLIRDLGWEIPQEMINMEDPIEVSEYVEAMAEKYRGL